MDRHSHLRASDADRDQIVERLRVAATEGRLAAEELDERVYAALTAVTYADLDVTVRDLPGPRRRAAGAGDGPEAERPARRRAAGGDERPTRRRPTRRRTAGGVAVAAVRANPFLIVFLIPLVAVTGAMLIAASAVWAVFMIIVLLSGRSWAGSSRHPFGSRHGGGPWSLVWDRDDSAGDR